MTRALDALMRRASRIAEDIFKDRGSLDPIWLIELADGKQEIIAFPIPAPDGAAGEYKESLSAGMRKLFHDKGVRRYAWAMECWIVSGRTTDSEAHDSLHDHPDRTEVIVVHADDGFETRLGYREIIRSGGRVYLGKLDIETPGPRTQGRFFGLLNATQHPTTIN